MKTASILSVLFLITGLLSGQAPENRPAIGTPMAPDQPSTLSVSDPDSIATGEPAAEPLGDEPFAPFPTLLWEDPGTGNREPAADLGHPLAGIRSAEDVTRLMSGRHDSIEELLSSMSLPRKVGQMVFPRINAHFISGDSEAYREMMEYVRDLHVGGITFFSGDVHELATLAHDFQQQAQIPLLISADFERGVTMRIRRATGFPPAMALGAADNEHLAYRKGAAIALEARSLGVLFNFAPLVDVNNNPENPVINVRSFGEDPDRVSRLAAAYIRGLHDGGMLSTGKHFPGHGDTDMDSHLELPAVPHDIERLERVELAPFRHIINHGVTAIMTAHIALPELTGKKNLPATLSDELLTGLLRQQLGFEGLIVTDALDMHSIDRFHSREEAAIRAVRAGADILLLPPDPHTAIEAVVSAVRLGEISEERIDASVRRILSAKQAVGLNRHPELDLNRIRHTVGHKHHRDLAETIAKRSMTLVRNKNRYFPIRSSAGQDILLITVLDQEGQRTAVHRHNHPLTSEPAGTWFANRFRQQHPRFRQAILDPRSNDQEIRELIESAEQADRVLIHSYAMARSGDGDLHLPDKMEQALQQLGELDRPVGVISFGDPYFIRRIPQADAYLIAWSSDETSVEAAVETVVGSNSPSGRLPITIPDISDRGEGLTW